MSNKTYRIAIVGASSLLGKELSDALSESPLGASSFTLLDEEQLAGNVAAAGDEISFIQKIDATSFEGKDLVFFAGEAAVTLKHWRSALKAEASIVDLTGAVERQPGVLVRAPWVASAAPPASGLSAVQNGSAAHGAGGASHGVGASRGGGGKAPDIATPAVVTAHPAAVLLALLAARLGERHTVRTLMATVLLPASEFGRAAMDELHQQTVSLLSFQSLPREQYDAQVAFNLVRSWGESAKVPLKVEEIEARIQANYAAIAAAGSPEVVLQVVHAPVFHGYGASLLVELETAATQQEVASALLGKHVEVMAGAEAPNNVDAAGQDELVVSVQAVKPEGAGRQFRLWVATDNLRLAASNAVACGVELLQLRPSGEVQ
jgi:aspartate-semialdehyde dehydrogenase